MHGLNEGHEDRSLEFCEIWVDQYEVRPTLIDIIAWADESHFKLSRSVDMHSCTYWASENSHVIMQSQLYQQGVTVWPGVSSSGIIGPSFFGKTVTATNCLETLQTAVFTVLQQEDDVHVIYLYRMRHRRIFLLK